MATRDLRSNIGEIECLAPILCTADKTGTGVDLKGYESAVMIANLGAEGDTLSGSVYIQLELEESTDDSTYTDVAVADMQGETGAASGLWATIDVAAEASQVYSVGYSGGSRYIRGIVNVTGTHTNGTIVGLIVVRGNPQSGVSHTANPAAA